MPATRVNYLRSLSKIVHLSDEAKAELESVSKQYAFRVSDYYLGLVDWGDPDDPIRQLILPRVEELHEWGSLDASNELSVTVAKGVQHKYKDTALLLCNKACGAYCRYCFRKRLFMNENDEVMHDVTEGIRYITAHPEINNVLLTGGDPLLIRANRLADLFSSLSAIPHVRVIRLGSKMPAFNPWCILDNSELQAAFRTFSGGARRIYLMAHFDHPRELTEPALESIACCLANGLICVNQCPVIRGINDDPGVLAALFETLSYIGCPQYYVFQCRPTAGNEPYCLPIVRTWQVFSEAMRRGSGLARRARLVLSHETGKVEVMSVDARQIYLRYHEAKDPADTGRLLICHRDDQAVWLDDLRPVDG
ncbi:MAG: KamA family radical SAM protein [Planctomycetales bacterium 71-10]|nr:MAG: KamA family radical SAM protein [Planctomycetales bacterium 71-10]